MDESDHEYTPCQSVKKKLRTWFNIYPSWIPPCQNHFWHSMLAFTLIALFTFKWHVNKPQWIPKRWRASEVFRKVDEGNLINFLPTLFFIFPYFNYNFFVDTNQRHLMTFLKYTKIISGKLSISSFSQNDKKEAFIFKAIRIFIPNA